MTMWQGYEVRWEIELDAVSPNEAAGMALAVHRDRNSLATHFQVRPAGSSLPWLPIDASLVRLDSPPGWLPCYDCGSPEACYVLVGHPVYDVGNAAWRRCALCAAEAAASGEQIARLHDLYEGFVVLMLGLPDGR